MNIRELENIIKEAKNGLDLISMNLCTIKECRVRLEWCLTQIKGDSRDDEVKAKIKEILRDLINCASVDGITEEGLERSVDDIIALFLFEVDSRTDLGEDGLLTTEQLNDIVRRYTDKDRQTFALGTIIKEIAKAQAALTSRLKDEQFIQNIDAHIEYCKNAPENEDEWKKFLFNTLDHIKETIENNWQVIKSEVVDNED